MTAEKETQKKINKILTHLCRKSPKMRQIH